MFIALTIATILLARMAAGSAARSCNATDGARRHRRHRRRPRPLHPCPRPLELAGATGILLGLWLEPLGIAAAAGLVAYFIGAIIGHLRVGDTKGAAMPAMPLLLSITVLVLRVVTL